MKIILTKISLYIFVITTEISATDNSYKRCHEYKDCNNSNSCATIFQHAKYGGWSQCFPLQGRECVSLNSWWQGEHWLYDFGPRVSSLMVHKGCVRLYSFPNCIGNSFDTFNNQKDLSNIYFNDDFNDKARSISSCTRPKPESGCVVHFLFSATMHSTEISFLVNKLLTGTDKLIQNLASPSKSFEVTDNKSLLSTAAKLIPRCNEIVSSIIKIRKLFQDSQSILIDAEIDKSIAIKSAIQMSTKMQTIENRLKSIFSNETSDQKKQIDLGIAMTTCEEAIVSLGSSVNAFRRNKLISSPYLFMFSSVFLTVARLELLINNDTFSRSHIASKALELKVLNEKYLENAIKIRQSLIRIIETRDGKMGPGGVSKCEWLRVQDGLVCEKKFLFTSKGPLCEMYRRTKCYDRSCFYSVMSSIRSKLTEFFEPVIRSLDKISESNGRVYCD